MEYAVLDGYLVRGGDDDLLDLRLHKITVVTKYQYKHQKAGNGTMTDIDRASKLIYHMFQHLLR